MEVKINKDKEVVIRHKLKAHEDYKIFKGNKFDSVTFYKKPQIVSGYSNMCSDGRAILVIDYDSVDISVVEEDYRSIQELFKLPPGYLFETKKGHFHVVCLKKYFPPWIFQILQSTRADSSFKTMPNRNPFKSYILRISDKKGSKKPKFVGTLDFNLNKNLRWEISSAHKKLLSKIFPKIKHPPYSHEDKLTKIRLQRYET